MVKVPSSIGLAKVATSSANIGLSKIPRRKRVRYFVEAVVIGRRKHQVRAESVELNHRRKSSMTKDRVARRRTSAKKERNDEQLLRLSAPPEEEPLQSNSQSPDVKIREESPDPILPVAAGLEHQKEVDEKIMKKWKNPKMTVKKENMAFPSDTIRARLASANISSQPMDINCSKDLLDETVSRAFMSNVYGGSSQMTFPPIGKKKLARHGLNDFMYLNTSYQPIAPEVPGAPGIWITTGGDEEWEWDDGIVRVFTKITKTPAEWSYQGQYELKRAKSLTKEEWASLRPSVRNTWAREICKQEWGIDMCIRVYGRMKLKRLPTKAEYKSIEDQKLYESVDPTDVALYLTRGDEKLSLVTMKCVGYDIPFQTQLVNSWKTWTPKEKSATKRKTESVTQTKTGPKRLTKRQKLEEKVIVVDELYSEDEDDDSGVAEDEYGDSDSESDGEFRSEELVYIPRGTRSRPRM